MNVHRRTLGALCGYDLGNFIIAWKMVPSYGVPGVPTLCMVHGSGSKQAANKQTKQKQAQVSVSF